MNTSHLALGLLAILLSTTLACTDGKGGDGETDGGSTSDGGSSVDEDGDRFNADEDCDDTNPAVYPGAVEFCDGVDNDCDGEIDEGAVDMRTWYADADGDGFGVSTDTVLACQAPEGYSEFPTDCDDSDAARFPGNPEVCDGLDNDCNLVVDDGISGTLFRDADGDGYGESTDRREGCDPEPGWVWDSTDCDDTEAARFPGNPEVCDGLDNDCDFEVDEGVLVLLYVDADGDGHGDPETMDYGCEGLEGYSLTPTDCDDTEAARFEGNPEICDGLDNDCNELVDDGLLWTAWQDADGDGFGDESVSSEICVDTDGWVTNALDCDDTLSSVNPDGIEVCNDIDDDCDGTVDVGAADAIWLFEDADLDGLGAPGTERLACDGAENDYDCNDGDATEPQVAASSGGSSSGDGSYSAPYDTIQAAVNGADECVIVLAGTYTESVDFGGRNISVVGVEGAAETIIDATGLSEPVVRIASGETSAATLQGFTLTGGEGDLETTSESTSCSSSTICTDYFYTWCGGGLYVDGSDPTLLDLIVVENLLPELEYSASGNDEYYTYSYGGGACFLDSLASLQNVSFAENFADQGGGIYIDSSSTLALEQVGLYQNTATDGGGVQLDGGSLSLTNGVLAWNEATTDGGGLLVLEGSSTLVNVTVTGGAATDGGGVWYTGTSSNTLLNSIIAFNSSDGVRTESGASSSIQYCDVYGNDDDWGGGTSLEGTTGNISSDPRFTAWSDDGDWSNDDFVLRSTSPAIDVGHPSPAYYDADGSRNDLGAYGGPGGSW